MIFLIDFENVSSVIFDEIEKYSGEDKIIIFYPEKTAKLPISTHIKFENSSIKREYISVRTGGKNALDFQLSTYLGYLIANNPNESYVIVSKDTGFDFVCNFWKNRDVDVKRSPRLSLEENDRIHREIAQALEGQDVNLDEVYAIVDKYKTKQGVNNAIVKIHGTEKTKVIYRAIKSILVDKK